MLPIKTLPISSPKLPAKSGLGNFRNKPNRGLTSIANQTGKTSAFHQFGDTVSRAKKGERSDKIYGSVNAAIKGSRPPKPKTEDGDYKLNDLAKY